MKWSLAFASLVVAWSGFADQSDAARHHSEMMNAAPAARAQSRAGGVKVLFLGNSITLHGPLPSIGWTNDWGMAASAPEKDFVHIVTEGIARETGREVDLRVKNLAAFERGFETWDAERELADEIAFEPDYLVVALGENVNWLDGEDFQLGWRKAFKDMLGCFFTGRKRPLAVVRGCFWPCAWKDKTMAHAASDYAVPFAKADFGNDPAMKAIGLFDHKGVQEHPGDRGMAAIAASILETLFPTNAGYAVTVNGASVRVRPIRVSAMPYNAWRPGYQRPVDQTEIAGMAHLQSDGPVTLTVRPDRKFVRATVRPLSKGVKADVTDGLVTFAVPGPGQYVLELDDWHRPLEIFVDPVRDFAKERAEANIVFGPGRHEPVVVKLRSHDRVYIDKDAVVFGSFQIDNAEDVRISGYGVISGARNRREEINLSGKTAGTCYRDGQDAALRIVDSKNITVDGPTVVDSCCWMVEAFKSSDLVFDRVKVTGAWRYNTDGIDICNSQRVRIRDCYVHSFDDSIVLKGIPVDRAAPVEDVRVERCVCWCGWGRTLEIGYETWAPHYRGIVFEDCDLIRNFGGALSVHLGGDAPVEDVVYRKIRIEYGPHDLPQVLQRDRDAPYSGKAPATGYWLMVSNDKMYKEGGGFYGAQAELAKLPHGNFKSVTIEDVDITVEPGGREPMAAVGPEPGTTFGTLTVSGVRLNGSPWTNAVPNADGYRMPDAATQKRTAMFRERMFSPEARTTFYEETVEAFRTHYDDCREDAYRNGQLSGTWQGEYWGKTMLSGAAVAEMTGSAEFKAWLREKALAFVREFQQPDGYLCSYRFREFVGGKVGAQPGKEIFCWNLWGRKYTMWALIELARVCDEPKLLDAAAKMMDQEIAQLAKTKVEIWDTGFFSGIPSMSVLKPLMLLYRATGKKDYLDFARHLVGGWERADGSKPNLVANAFTDKPVHEWYDDTEWAKAYEIMSCLEGLVEFAAVTGEPRYRDAAVRIAEQLRRHEANAIGSVGFGDKFHNAARMVNATTEVCDVIHWMRLTHVLYRATGEARYLDDFEFAYLNAFLGGVQRDGKWAAQFSRSHGSRQQTADHQVGMKYHHCCVDNSPRAFADAWDAAVDMTADGTLSVNLYSPLKRTVGGTAVEIGGRYPVETEVTVDVKPTNAGKVRFRVPGWCEGLSVDGKAVAAADGWFVTDVPAEGHRFALSFARSVRAVPFRGEPLDLKYADQTVMFEKDWIIPEMKGLARTTPGTHLVYGPVVLAKSLSSGTPRDEIFRDRLVGKPDAELSIRPRPAVDSAGAWTLTVDGVDIPVCDFATASDRDDPNNRYSIWF